MRTGKMIQKSSVFENLTKLIQNQLLKNQIEASSKAVQIQLKNDDIKSKL